jgi:uncharacterized protein YoxC
MNPVLEIAVLAVAVVFIVMGVVAIRALTRFEKTAVEVAKAAAAVRATVTHAEAVTLEIHELTESFQSIVPHLQRTAQSFEAIGDRTAGLGHALLDQVEPPVKTAVAVVNGVRTGTRTFLESLTRRVRQRRQGTNGNGGDHHV